MTEKTWHQSAKMQTKGPTRIEEYRCTLCKYLVSNLFTSGREPVYDYYCTEPRAQELRVFRSCFMPRTESHRRIGKDDVTPWWCPFLRGQLNGEYDRKAD